MSSKEKSQETQKVKKTKINNNNKNNGEKKTKFKHRHPKIALTIKIIIIAIIVLAIIAGGIVAGAFFGLLGNDLKINESDLVIKYQNSTVYDKDGNVIATLSGGTKRKIVKLSEMAEYLPKAYIAIEDERFETHIGVDLKRTAAATVNFILKGGKSSFGGSTITQQLIKNITEDKENTSIAGVIRKVKEMSKAIQVERYLSKDQILELYLNQIFVGGDDINGVALGAIYFFDKDVKDLSIAECAYMAGINHVPNAYKPFEDFSDKENPEEEKQKMTEKINKRTKTVISKMLELGYISEEQANDANTEVDNGLKFQKGDGASVTTDLSYHTEAAIEQILKQIKEETDMSDSMAEMYLFSSGLNIYTTQDTSIQTVLESEISDKKYVTKSTYTYKDKKTNETVKETQYSLPTMVIIDHNNGEVVASATAVGSAEERNTRTKIGYFNYPTEIKKQTGSSMKPISVIAPGLETGTITGATLYDDSPTTFGGNYKPKNYYQGYKGIINVRTAIRLSSNIPHVKMLADMGLQNSIDFCKSVGLPEFKEEGLSLALGGLSEGVSMYEMAGAYSAIANDGVYIKPTFYTKVTDSDGNVLYEADKTENRVMSEQNAYIEKSILMEPVTGGSGATATYCAINGMDVAAKTGTTNGDYDRWLCGFTPYYTAATWYGYKNNAAVSYTGNPAGKIWDAVMTEIHKDLEKKKFEEPEGIIKASICRVSGKKAKDGCTDVYTDIFTKDNLPSECDGHSKAVVCRDSGLLPTEYCPQSSWEERTFAYQPEKERNQTKWTTVHENAEGAAVNTVPTERCNIHTQPQQQSCSHSFTDWKAQDSNPAVQERRCTLCQTVEYRNTPNYTSPTEHTHSWTEKVTKTATCKEEGIKTLTCSCGAKKEEKIAKTGHKEGPADSNGKTVCTVCGATIKEGTKPHTHSYKETIIKNSTCKEAGKKKLECDCGDAKEEDLPLGAHSSGEPDPVTGEVFCTVCGAKL